METLLANSRDPVRLVVFNTCFRSARPANHRECAVELAIGAESMIGDEHAVLFATTFYGNSPRPACPPGFQLASVHFGNVEAGVRLQSLEATGVDAGAVVFAEPHTKRK